MSNPLSPLWTRSVIAVVGLSLLLVLVGAASALDLIPMDENEEIAETQVTVDSEPHYLKKLKNHPDSPDALVGLGVVRHLQNRIAEAKELFSRAIEVSPDYDRAYYDLGLLYMDEKDYSVGIPYLRKAVSLKSESVVYKRDLGHALVGSGELAEGIPLLLQAIGTEHEGFDLHVQLGSVYNRLGQVKKSMTHCKQAIRIRRDDSNGFLCLGLGHAAMGEHMKALSAFDDALKLNPKDPMVLLNKGIAYERLGRHSLGMKTLRQCITAAPTFLQCKESLGRFLTASKKREERDEAISLLSEVIEHSQANETNFLALAHIYMTDGDLDRAEAIVKRLLRLKPGYGLGKNMLAYLQQLRDEQRASGTTTGDDATPKKQQQSGDNSRSGSSKSSSASSASSSTKDPNREDL